MDPVTSSPAPAPAPAPSPAPNPLEVYAKNLLYERGAATLDPDLVLGMKEDILQRLDLLSTQVMIDALTDQDAAEFERMVENGATAEQLQQFAGEKIPDLGERMTEALVRFRDTYLGEAA